MKNSVDETMYSKLLTDVTIENFNKLKMNEYIELKCRICDKFFKQTKGMILKSFNNGFNSGFCSRNCSNKSKKNKIDSKCEECGLNIQIRKWQHDNYNHFFCSYTCSAKYRNKNKTSGYKRSKIEAFVENKIKENFPKLVFKCNERKLLNGLELDFYFPEIKLGIELNGITHYEPIYGLDRLTRSKDSDKRKMILCNEIGVELAVINISQFKYFTENCKKIIWKEIEEILFPLASFSCK